MGFASMLVRPVTERRVFPCVGDVLASSLAAATDQASHNLLTAVSTGLSAFQLRSGRRLGRGEHVARLGALHLHGCRAELAGEWARAEFLFGERERQIERITDAHWAASASACDFSGDADQWRRVVMTELVLDAHIAFYNGYFNTDCNRTLLHITAVEWLADKCGFSVSDLALLLAPATDARIRALRRSGDLDSAIEHARERLRNVPNRLDYEQEFVELVMERAELSPSTFRILVREFWSRADRRSPWSRRS
jgi:hypothetical protein